MRDPEYDRFGPWIIEISEEDPLPPLFISHMMRKEKPFFCIKIPRPVDRRNLMPGMNMYDYVLSLFDNDLYVLERDGEDVRERSIPYKNIMALRHTENLLDGNLHIYIAEKCFNIPYSTVSSEIITRMVDLLRKRYIIDSHLEIETIKIKHMSAAPEEISFFFSGLLKRAREYHPDMNLLAIQVEVSVNSIEDNHLRRLFFGAIDKRLLESIHMCNGRELEIISRGRTWGYRWQAIYGKETLFLPLEKIRRIDREQEKSNRGIENLIFQTAGSRHSFSFTKENPALSDYLESIKDVAV